jgi:prevent-host-death family protein
MGAIKMKRIVQAGKFKAECLKIMDEVKLKQQSVIITKRGEQIAKLTPIEDEKKSLFGKMKGSVHIKGDLIQPTGEEWNASL